MATFKEADVYCLDGTSMNVLDRVKTRLYSDRPLTPDERRDLANAMDAAMRPAWRVDEVTR